MRQAPRAVRLTSEADRGRRAVITVQAGLPMPNGMGNRAARDPSPAIYAWLPKAPAAPNIGAYGSDVRCIAEEGD